MKLKGILLLLLFSFIVLSPNSVKAQCCPYHHPHHYHGYCCYKVHLGEPYIYFDLFDIYYQRWVSSFLRGKPVIILTAHRYQRYELLKWAEAFRQEYMNTGKAYVLWVQNLRKCYWNTSRHTVYDQWRWFNPTVPLLLDWDGVVGKSLRINYNVPNIIVLDEYGRLVMHEMHTYTPEVYKAVSAKIRPYCRKLRKGRRGDSL